MLWALIGVAAGLVTCLAIWAIDVPRTKLLSEVARRRGHRFAIGCVRCAVALVGALLLGGLAAGFYKACCETPPIMIGTFAVQSEYSWPRTLTAAAVLLGLAEIVWLGLWWLGSQSAAADGAQAHSETTATPRRVPFRLIAQRVALVALLVPLAGAVGGLWWQLVMPVALPADLPGAENEARLDALAGQLDWSALPSQDPDVATSAVCQSFALLNANRLATAHDILAGPCAVIVDYHEPFPGIAGAMRLRELARAFVLQSRAAADRDDPAEAVSAGLDCFRAGSRGQRGGMLFHRLIGLALESVALDVFADLAPTLGREQSRRLDAALAAAERDRELPGDVLAREYAWDMTANGWSGRLHRRLEDVASGKAPFGDALVAADNRTLALLRLVRAELAIHGYRRDEGNFPASLQALVPDWLDEVPLDPFSGQALVYRADVEGYVLYSVGNDRTNDRGIIDEWIGMTPGTDLSLESCRLQSIASQQWQAQAAASPPAQAQAPDAKSVP